MNLRAWERGEASPTRLGKHFASAALLAAVLLSEYRRAVAAERRYQELRHSSALTLPHNGVTGAGIARRVFTEMYAHPSHKR